MNNIETIIFTNENHIDILNVTLPRFINYLKPINSKINVITNKIVNNTKIDFSQVNVIETMVNFDNNGGHFRKSMITALKVINSKYILFFCDDYMINSIIKNETFNNVMKTIEHYGCDYMSFSSLKYNRVDLTKWEIINDDLSSFGIDGGVLYQINENYRHLYSVQPCIWKKESLIELLEYNENITLHMLDNTMIKNKRGYDRVLNYETNYFEPDDLTCLDYGFKSYTIDLPPFSFNIDDRDLYSDYFIFDYGEIMRHGKIQSSNTNTIIILTQFLNENTDIKNKILKFLE
jgi:hypothetical protein